VTFIVGLDASTRAYIGPATLPEPGQSSSCVGMTQSRNETTPIVAPAGTFSLTTTFGTDDAQPNEAADRINTLTIRETRITLSPLNGYRSGDAMLIPTNIDRAWPVH
jgi:hypothetical protein